ncbi:hypothetical protein Tco_0603197 [Tanacetum coccineum]
MLGHYQTLRSYVNEWFDNLFGALYGKELWVLLEFDNTKAKELFRDNVGVGSWFSVLRQASHDFTPEGIMLGGMLKESILVLTGKTFKKIATSGVNYWINGWIPEVLEDEEDDDHSEQEFISSEQSDLGLHIDGEDNGASEVPETIFENSDGMKERQSEDPFGYTQILNKNKVKSDVIWEFNDENPSLKYPPGFTPSVEKNVSERDLEKIDQVQNISDNSSRKFKMSEIPRTGGSILSVMEEIMKVGITMGYNMDGCANDITKIIESQGGYGKDAPGDDSNAMRNLCGKLKFLKVKIPSLGSFSVKSIRKDDANCFPIITRQRDGINPVPLKVNIMA